MIITQSKYRTVTYKGRIADIIECTYDSNHTQIVWLHPFALTDRWNGLGQGGGTCHKVGTIELVQQGHKSEGINRTQTKRFYTFVFNGKEKDYESGFHYYGARYYWSEVLTGWLSVDPMMDKYPSISPYAYCAWNPVKLVDPDGREFGDIYNLRGQHIGSDGRNDNVVYLKSTWSNRQLSTVESNFLIMFGGVKSITEETGLTNDELNLRATLSTIKQAEAGRKNPPLDYNSWNGSDHFTEDSYVDNPKAYARHPGTNPNTKRSASGAYQFLKKFWDSDDFSPQAQDKAAVNLMTKSGYEAALNGDMAGFINSSSKRWTSLSQWEVSDLQDEFCYNRAKELVGKTNIATPIGSLLKKN